MATTNLNIRTDKEVKDKAEEIFSELGLNMTTAVNIFLRTAIREHGIPFELKLDIPNDITAAAIEEGRKIMSDPNTPRYSSMDALRGFGSMKYDVQFTSQFKKDLKLAKKQHKNLDKLFSVINTLANGETLNAKYKDHDLMGNYKGTRECHIDPDWLLVYEIKDDVLVLMLYRLGPHLELF